VREYRKRLDEDIWHFHSDCPFYPTTNVYAQFILPSTGELCPECKSRSAEGSLTRPRARSSIAEKPALIKWPG
jgi:hypothetical protein